MVKIKQVEQLVMSALEKFSITRQDDFILYGAVLKEIGIPMNKWTIAEFLINAKKYDIPAFETVSRCRRHIQQKRKDLINPEIAAARSEMQNKFKDYNKTNLKGE